MYLLGMRPVSTCPCVYRKKTRRLTDRHARAFLCRTRRWKDAAGQWQQRDEDQSSRNHLHLLLFLHFLHLFYFSFSLQHLSVCLWVCLQQQQQQQQLSSSSSHCGFILVSVVVIVVSAVWASAAWLTIWSQICSPCLWWNPDVCVWAWYVYLCEDHSFKPQWSGLRVQAQVWWSELDI